MEEYLDQIKERLSIFKGMYSHIRIVDPKKKISSCEILSKEDSISRNDSCYNLWEASKQCENCISARALITNKNAVKIEINKEKTYLVEAYPVTISSQIFIVEIIKDISDEEIFIPKNIKGNLKNYVENLNKKLTTDDLTGVYNRRFIQERLPTDLYKSKNNGEAVAIVMVDIDYFKKVNDSYGHLIGDRVLKELAQLMNESIRKSTDWIARYGGEEFIIILNGINRVKAVEIIEKIRVKIESHVFKHNGNMIKITCSFGINVVTESNYDFNKLIRPADECLYLAKNKGRNQSIIIPIDCTGLLK